MILSASQIIAAPQAFVFARATEFDRLLRAAESRGAEIAPPERDGARLRCALRYPFRQEMWPAVVVVERVVPPDGLDLSIEGRLAVARATVRFRPAGAEITQVALRAEFRPVGLQGRVLIGSLHMLRGRVQERLDRDLAALASAAETLWQQEPG